MWVKKMAKTMKEAKPKSKSPAYLPRLRFVFGLVLIGVAATSYLQQFAFPKLFFEALLLLTGIWMIVISLSTASAHRRRAIAKRYI